MSAAQRFMALVDEVFAHTGDDDKENIEANEPLTLLTVNSLLLEAFKVRSDASWSDVPEETLKRIIDLLGNEITEAEEIVPNLAEGPETAVRSRVIGTVY